MFELCREIVLVARDNVIQIDAYRKFCLTRACTERNYHGKTRTKEKAP